MAKPKTGKDESSIDTQFLPKIENESLALDENHTPIGVHGSSGLPGILAENDINSDKPEETS